MKSGEIHPLRVPMQLNNYSFPPTVSQELSMACGQACPERINPSCLKCNTTEDGGNKHPPEAVGFVMLMLLVLPWQALKYINPNFCINPTAVNRVACELFTLACA